MSSFCNPVMMKAVRYYNQTDMMQLSIIFKIYHTWMNSCLWVVPMEALYFILKYERVVFCSHNLLKISQVVSWISNLLGRMTAVLQWISKQYFQLVTKGIQEIIRWITYCLKCGSVNRDPLLVCNSINHVIICFLNFFLNFDMGSASWNSSHSLR